ncbi:hypothetical protein [uncultured Desulfosarcina sp.]|uniref:hypothetical protein n=1 Tax=uncultured Desulfosarcina sp. TaxID=218289 RepID=UPI0029C99099|nr:hypothetical protein [uncultured Desulfosarcina sp.]
MIENFDQIKEQLKELAEIVNSFKSEQVQLKVVELLFGDLKIDPATGRSQSQSESSKPPQKDNIAPKKKKRAASKTNSANKPAVKTQVGKGPVATITKLYEGDFFNEPKALKDIIEHCEINLARRIKQSDISGKLARMVRNGELTRVKNSDGQYEYTKA